MAGDTDSNITPLVLAVDDTDMARRLMVKAVRRSGYKTIEAVNGEEAVEAFRQYRPDMALLDAHMPIMDGFEACERIRKSPGGGRVPILMITGLDDKDSIERAFSMGATDFITKPINWHVLHHRIRHVLQGYKAQQALYESEAQLQLIMNNIPMIIFVMNREGVVTLAKGQGVAGNNMRIQEMVGKSVFKVLSHTEELQEHIRNALTGRSGHQIFQTPSTGLVLDVWVTPLHSPEGEILGAIGISSDITERHRREKQLQTQREVEMELRLTNQRLDELNELKSNFLTTVSHELRTPMNIIIGHLEMITKGFHGRLNESQQPRLEIALEHARHLMDMIHDVFDLTMINSGDMELKREAVNIPMLVDECVQEMHPLAEKKRLKLTYQATRDLPPAYVDQRRILQVILNLISNAIKFTDKGRIDIQVMPATPKNTPDCPRDLTPSEWLLLTIQDTGIGMSAEQQRVIFTEFRQADGSVQRTHQGMGLGLALTRKLVLLMDGEIWVDSVPEKGSTFYVVIPVFDAHRQDSDADSD